MTQPYLVMRQRSTVNSQVAVFKDIDKQLIQIGSDFGTDEVTSYTYQHFNKVTRWNNDLYAINRSTIYKYDVASGSGWLPFYTFASVNGAAQVNERLGFVPCSIDGSGVLVCGYPSTGGNTSAARLVKIDQAGNVTETSVFNTHHDRTGTAYRGFNCPIAYRNAIYWSDNPLLVNGGNSAFQFYDLKNGYSKVWDGGSNMWVAPCVHRDKLYVLRPTTYEFIYTGKIQFGRIDGTSYVNLANLPTVGGAPQGPNIGRGHLPCLISFKDELYAFWIDNNGTAGTNGWRCHRINLNDDGGFVDTTEMFVIPAELKRSGSRYHNDQQLLPKIDLVTDPLNPKIEFELWGTDNPNGQDAEGSTVYQYEWVDAPSGALTYRGGGLDSFRYTRMYTNQGGGGERIWPGSGTLNASAPVLSLEGANINVEVEIFGGPGGTGIALQVLYDKEGELVDNVGTLVSVGGSAPNAWVSGNTVVGLSAGDRPIVSWAAAINGIEPADNPRVCARVFLV